MDCLNHKENQGNKLVGKINQGDLYISIYCLSLIIMIIYTYIYVCVCLCIYSLHCILASAQKQAVLRGAEDALRSVRSSGETDPKDG